MLLWGREATCAHDAHSLSPPCSANIISLILTTALQIRIITSICQLREERIREAKELTQDHTARKMAARTHTQGCPRQGTCAPLVPSLHILPRALSCSLSLPLLVFTSLCSCSVLCNTAFLTVLLGVRWGQGCSLLPTSKMTLGTQEELSKPGPPDEQLWPRTKTPF